MRVRGIAKLLDQVRALDDAGDVAFEVEAEDELPFVQLGHWVGLSGVSAGALALYWMLAMHLNQGRGDRYVWPTQSILAHMLGYSRGDKIKRFADELVAIGALVVIPVPDVDGPQKRNVYRLRRTPPPGYIGHTSLSSYYAALNEEYEEETAGQPVCPRLGGDVHPVSGGHVAPETGAVTTRTTNKKKRDAPSARSAALGARSASTSGSGGAGEGGSAASSKTTPPSEAQNDQQVPQGRPVVKPRKQRAAGHTRQQLEQAREVCALFPAVLGVSLVPVLTDAILGALAGDAPGADRTVEQLGARIEQRWNHHGYASKFHAGELTSPVGAAVAMVRPLTAGDRYGCANPRCEDGADLDSGQACTVCPERLADRRTQRRHNATQAAPDEPPLPPVSPAPVRPRRAAEPPYDAPRRPVKPAVPAQVQPVGDYSQGAGAARMLLQGSKAAAHRRNNLLDKAR